ncbi:MmgE/PrpD family protein [Polaromonas sp. P1-6]|nr:MmgE/PrpD family protein [Polaromonas sp. P1-6]
MSGKTVGAGRTIARFCVGFDASRLTGAHVRTCGRAIADTVACAIAGWNEPPAVRAIEYAFKLMNAGQGALWGRSEHVGLETSVLCNAIAAHALDYDDASTQMNGHPSVVLLPALLGLGAARGATGQHLALAYLVGFEVACALGRSVATAHYARGWHLTSTIGALASAVACARILNLDEDATNHSIGLAFAQTAGSREFRDGRQAVSGRACGFGRAPGGPAGRNRFYGG